MTDQPPGPHQPGSLEEVYRRLLAERYAPLPARDRIEDRRQRLLGPTAQWGYVQSLSGVRSAPPEDTPDPTTEEPREDP